MEKEKVIKALENCIGCRPCKNCPYEKGYLNFPSCAVDMFKDALAIINEFIKKEEIACPVCGGMGFVTKSFYEVPGNTISFGGYEALTGTTPCRRCGGKGTIEMAPPLEK